MKHEKPSTMTNMTSPMEKPTYCCRWQAQIFELKFTCISACSMWYIVKSKSSVTRPYFSIHHLLQNNMCPLPRGRLLSIDWDLCWTNLLAPFTLVLHPVSIIRLPFFKKSPTTKGKRKVVFEIYFVKDSARVSWRFLYDSLVSLMLTRNGLTFSRSVFLLFLSPFQKCKTTPYFHHWQGSEGDPLSPCSFVLCMERLPFFRNWKGIKAFTTTLLLVTSSYNIIIFAKDIESAIMRICNDRSLKEFSEAPAF